ncbi:MAG TPA: hypothetical protein V6D22_02565, partial [Candidatus Obscuribacterales bacterium]
MSDLHHWSWVGFVRANNGARHKEEGRKPDRAPGNLRSRGDKQVTLTRVVYMMMAALMLMPTLATQAQAATNYNLGSQTANISAPTAGNIVVGGHTQAISAGQMITPAELTALTQVTQTGRQSLVISNLGTAIGGRFSVSNLTQSIGSLVIPQGVTGFDNITHQTAGLGLAGDLVNAGTLYAFSRSSTSPTAFINATNIFNNQGGLLSTVVPFASLGMVAGLSHVNLNLSALNDIMNAGTISSSGSLSLSAGGQIVNALPSGATGATPLVQAWKDVNLTALSGNITNSGTILASIGNVNVLNAMNDINWNGIGGTVSAPKGNINLHDANFTGSGNITLNGGDWLSKQLNFWAGCGAVNADIGNVTGVVNTSAGSNHLSADT